jgi:uncharacterized protein DUF6689
MRSALGAGVFLLLGATSALAQPSIPLRIQGKNARGTIDLPGGVRADLTLSFEHVVGLSSTALQASARLVDPHDPALVARLPEGGLVTIPDAFPVLLRIAPSPSSALTFSGVVHLSLHTPNLHLDPATPMALFRAPDGGPFQDIALSEAEGSYRVCGSGGGFSEFLIVVDQRAAESPILAKFGAIQALITAQAPSMPPAVVAALRRLVNEARALHDAGALPAAADKAKELDKYVKDHSGTEIPDVWRAHDPGRINVAGLLRSQAKTLRFSLRRADE